MTCGCRLTTLYVRLPPFVCRWSVFSGTVLLISTLPGVLKIITYTSPTCENTLVLFPMGVFMRDTLITALDTLFTSFGNSHTHHWHSLCESCWLQNSVHLATRPVAIRLSFALLTELLILFGTDWSVTFALRILLDGLDRTSSCNYSGALCEYVFTSLLVKIGPMVSNTRFEDRRS